MSENDVTTDVGSVFVPLKIGSELIEIHVMEPLSPRKWQLMEKLERFDRAVKHEFGWFFYMAHGNRITSTEGMAVANAIRGGQVHLAPRDEAVLLAWSDDPYMS